ncbi:uncharacterized protein MONBRDRAFT_34300 [Monosiga brevicollis MX1]|uniref:Endonuclease n=1 Tax=Monosiga brevicollis TaxID=81824 RepID=A9VAT6_MONBE|nr:uncharacterized protein MONBRDRAFT_34300 [Monosiga brevicollis MX1]EDQ85432.1 predicted protein [Monosiga brevicollis MX1]|eukprot:XP_001749843.1 hypothetical protein [Monosiga brevicollis MX1]
MAAVRWLGRMTWAGLGAGVVYHLTAQPAQAASLPPSGGVESASSIMRFGYPESRPLKLRDGHVVHYDNRLRVPVWVCEHVNRDTISVPKGEAKVNRADCVFTEDQTIHPYFRSTDVDYKRSGYDRGHLAAAANHRQHLEAMKSTFFYSNIAPQVGKGMNRGAWNNLEIYTRRLARDNEVYVISGSLFVPQNGQVTYKVIGPNNVAVPTHFFKVLLIAARNDEERTARLQCFIMPNQEIPTGQNLAQFLVPLEQVEKLSGFTFFDKLPNKYGRVQRTAKGQLAGDFAKEDTS